MTEILADYGDAVLHVYGWFRRESPLQGAACRRHRDDRPVMLYLERQAPDGAALCPWCMEGKIAPPLPRRRETTPRAGHLDNAELRRAFRRSEVSAAEVARRIGWTRRVHGREEADSTRVLRMLGLTTAGIRDRRGVPVRQHSLRVENALLISRALGLAPVDVGL